MAAPTPLGVNSRNEFLHEMIATAKQMASPGKGLLASDGSDANLGRKFAPIGLANTVENRRRYREMLYSTPGLSAYISGIILNDEIFWSTVGGAADGRRLTEVVRAQGILVGIKTDLNVRALPLKANETFTAGIDGLRGRARRYYADGARFAKLRVVFRIQNGFVSSTALLENAVLSAKYALLCQSEGLVPIVEPELLRTGAHSLALCRFWTRKILAKMYKALSDYDVDLRATILKPNLCTAGSDAPKLRRSFRENAEATIDALCATVPLSVPGVMFLSGGQCEEEATRNLNAVNALFVERLGRPTIKNTAPWSISFSFGRALQTSAVSAWKGKDENIAAAQRAFLKRCKANSEAQRGVYKGDAMSETDRQTMIEQGYVLGTRSML